VLIVSLLVCETAQSALANMINIGETNVLALADSGNGNLLAAQNATLSQPATIQSLSFYVTQASGNLILGIYDASGPNGGPGALKAQTNSFTPIVGWNTANVIAPVSLPAGTYWLAYLPSSNSLSFMKGLTSGVSIRYYSYQFGALPTQFSTSPSSDPNHWSFYASLNPAPTISSLSLSNNSLTAGAPAGTVIGAISVTMSSGSFSGSLALSGANASSFKIVGSNLETNGVLPAGSYTISIIATQSGAANSPFTQVATITVVSQSISSVSLSNAPFVGGSPSGTVVGTINVTMSPTLPAFSGSLSLSTTKGGCTATNGVNNSSFAFSGNKLITNGPVAPGTYAVCILATEASASNRRVGQAAKLTANSTSITIGETNQLAGGVIGDANLLFAQSAALSQTATIESLSIYAAAGTGNLILGIYADNGSGAPGALQAQTASFSAVAGWNTANVTAPISLQPGTYWLAWLTDSNVLSVPAVTTGTDAYYPLSFGSLPPTFSGTATIETDHRSLYAMLNTRAVSQSISSVSLSNSSVVGGSPSGTIVGAINVAMSPSSPSFSGSLSLSTMQGGCTATNGANNSSFAISGGNLVTSGTVAPGSYAVCILATQAGATNSPLGQAKTITATQSISSISLSNSSVVGGSPSGTVVGTISVAMSSSSPAFSGSLSLSTTQGGCTASNGANNSNFAISGGNLVTSGTVAPGRYAVCILATQAGATNSPLAQAETITASQSISSISLSNSSVVGGSSSGAVVGTINVAMSPSSPAFSGSLSLSTTQGGCTATNGANNSSFGISGSNLVTSGTVAPGSYAVCILATQANAANSPLGQAETITASQSISSISLSNSSVVGPSPAGTVVGNINVTMSPSSPPFSGSLSLSTTQGGCTATNGANNSSFAISGDSLVTSGAVASGSYAVCILATQAGATNSPLGQAKTITGGSPAISNVALSCGSCSFSSASLTGNIGTLSSTPSAGINFSLTTTAGSSGTACSSTNGRDNGLFAISGTSLNIGATPLTPTGGAGGNGVYNICVAAAGSQSINSPYDQPFTVTVTAPISQNISSIALAQNDSFMPCAVSVCTTTGLSSGTAIATFSVPMSPATPVFNYTSPNISLATTGATCNGTNGAGNGSFQIVNDKLQTNGTPARGAYKICVSASESGVATAQAAFTVNVGTLITANSGTGCVGTGTSASPLTYQCLQNAFNSASTAGGINDTVSLPAGNYVLNTITDAAGTTLNKAVNVVGAGSGNTFDVYGHINNGSGTTPCPTSLSTVTCIYPTGTSFAYGSNPPNGTTPSRGTIKVGLDLGGSSCNNNTFAHIAFDASHVAPGGDDEGLLNFERCPGPITLSDIRFYTFDGKRPSFQGSASGTVLTVNASPSPVGIISVGTELYVNGTDSGAHIVSYGTGTGKAGTYNLSAAVTSGTANMQTDGNYETELYMQVTSNVLIQNSLLGIPLVDGSYSGAEAFESVADSTETLRNVLIWQGFIAPTNNQNEVFTGSITQTDLNNNLAAGVNYTGNTGCHLNPGNVNGAGCEYGGTNGTSHTTFTNNYFRTGTLMPNSIGGAVNDPSTNGNLSDVNITGNWVVGTNASIAACAWITSPAENFCNSLTAPSFNAVGDSTTCALSRDGSNGFNITNNSIIGSSVALIDGQGVGTMRCYANGDTLTSFHTEPIEIFGLNAQNNYFSSPSNQYTTNANTISPTQTNNYCTPAAGTVTGCATSGFTTPPTGAFTVGALYYDPTQSGNVAKFTSTGFTAQYGAVKWLASTSSTTPTSSGQTGTGCNGSACSWAFVPPASLAGVTHGSTVYMWVMDSAGNIGAATPQAIP
jgi:hypothetical protein